MKRLMAMLLVMMPLGLVWADEEATPTVPVVEEVVVPAPAPVPDEKPVEEPKPCEGDGCAVLDH